MKIIGLSGSLRTGSYNTSLLKAAKVEVADLMDLQIYTVHDIPLYNGDIETREGIPKKVQELKQELSNSDGLLLATPEYNHSLPGVLKNAIDWLTRPPKDIKKVFAGLPVAVLGASPSGFGTLLAQEAWLPVFRTLGMLPWFGKSLHLSKADTVFDSSGRITDSNISLQLRQFMLDFVSFIEVESQFSTRSKQLVKEPEMESLQ